VNIAARVGGAGKAGQVLISDPTRQALDESSFTFGRQRRLKAPGAPSKLTVCSVEGRS
jgi:class 3 adenylate cyclase